MLVLFFFFLMNEELFHQVTPFPQSSLAPTASRIKSKLFVLKSKAFHRLAPDSLINSVFPPCSSVNYQLQGGWLLLLPSLQTHTYCPSRTNDSSFTFLCLWFFHLKYSCCLSLFSKPYVNFKASRFGKESLTVHNHSDLFLLCSFMTFSFGATVMAAMGCACEGTYSLWPGIPLLPSLHVQQHCPVVYASV